MPLTQKHRSSIYRTLSPILGEEEAEAMLSQFPASEGDDLVTRSDLRVEAAELRADVLATRSDLRGEIAELRADVLATRSDLRGEIAELRTEMHALGGELRSEVAELRTEMHDMFRQHTVWFAGATIAGLGLATTIASII